MLRFWRSSARLSNAEMWTLRTEWNLHAAEPFRPSSRKKGEFETLNFISKPLFNKGNSFHQRCMEMGSRTISFRTNNKIRHIKRWPALNRTEKNDGYLDGNSKMQVGPLLAQESLWFYCGGQRTYSSYAWQLTTPFIFIITANMSVRFRRKLIPKWKQQLAAETRSLARSPGQPRRKVNGFWHDFKVSYNFAT